MNKWINTHNNKKNRLYSPLDVSSYEGPENHEYNTLSKNLQENIEIIKGVFGKNACLKIRNIELRDTQLIGILYLEGLADTNNIQDFILRSILTENNKRSQTTSLTDIVKYMKQHILTVGQVTVTSQMEQIIEAMLSGNTVLLFNSHTEACIASTKGQMERAITEPTSQNVVRGPRDGFTESLQTNVSLIFRRIKNPKLQFEKKTIGEITRTEVGIIYINTIANPDVVKEIHQRIENIHMDGVQESSYIEAALTEENFTPFPTVYNTERPDIIVAGLLEGRVAIVVDGTPFVLLAPALFVQFLQSNEDYYQAAFIATCTRFLRYISFFFSMLMPGIFIALTCYHQEIIPSSLLISLASQRGGVPFPPVIEVILMEITFEILREAGIRLPRSIGSAVSIVGALVLGDAAVQAGIVSPATVIIVAFTGISNFVLPAYNFSITVRLLRFVFLILGGVLGIFGLMIGIMALFIHLCDIRSFTVPYLFPYAPFNKESQKDALYRTPILNRKKRPKFLNFINKLRSKNPNQ
ncbi:spore germination protein [Bacillus wiedmannii]|uniref:spore germination protein n=1 Tax=Bacillus wiedmannii TaxID=1890302 RepID=UPI0015CF664E|nr:spore germination protein [Bacillus wiedmannii]